MSDVKEQTPHGESTACAFERAELASLRAERRRKFLERTCAICCEKLFARDSDEVVDYMMTDETWELAGLKPREVACLGCVEIRLGRPLAASDFGNALCNRLIHRCLAAGVAPWRRA